MEILDPLSYAIEIRILLAFLTSLLLSFYSIKALIRVAHTRKIYDQPNGRTTHLRPTPRLAGIAIFLSVILTSSLFIPMDAFPRFQFVVAGSVIIFFIGIKDDLVGISFSKKFIAEIAAATILILFAGFRFTNLHGFFGVGEISYPISYLLTLVIIIGIINAFNLIDGVDGLSGALALAAFATFGGWFWMNHQPGYALLCAATIGSLLSFLWYNVWSKRNKIFMGDTGALFLGFLVSLLVVQFNEMNLNPSLPLPVASSPMVSFGILIIPIFDTCRVMLARILQGKSPFYPDKTHIHHHLLNLGLSHKQVTAILFAASIGYTWFAFQLQHLNIYLSTIILVLTALALTFIPVYLYQRKADVAPWTVIRLMGKRKAG